MKNYHVTRLRLLFTAMLLAVTFSVKAQWSVGVQTGLTSNSLTTTSGYFYDRVYHSKIGLTFAVPVKYAFTDWFTLAAEAAAVQKNYLSKRSGFFEGIYDEANNTYLSVPIYAQFSFGGKRLRGFMNAGAYCGGWVSSFREGNIRRNFDNHIHHYEYYADFDPRKDNRFEAGTMIGTGISYLISSRLQIFGECRYYYSLTDMQKDYMKKQVPRYNNTFAYQIGIMLSLGNNKK